MSKIVKKIFLISNLCCFAFIGFSQSEAPKILTTAFGTAVSSNVKSVNIVVNDSAATVFIPVKYGTNIKKFNPMIKGKSSDVKVKPVGPQNFTKGPVTYTLSLDGVSTKYSVSVAVNNNPVISSGYFADPDIFYSEKTGKYYIYPTSDGFDNWGGYYFKVFSSVDLINWIDEGKIIDMSTGQVKWAQANAWAPCIIEKKINGVYKYFFYFSGGMPSEKLKKIGVAVADSPTGPFTVADSALISKTPRPDGKGHQIDPDVFTDPVSGKSFLYWGNGYMAVAELNDDMVSLKTPPQIMTPHNYTEATYVFFRGNKYYFMWSQGNTNNKDYKVRYATSDSPTGPLNIPADNVVLELDEANGIFGPAHNSVLQIQGTDQWYMVYHRIGRPNSIKMKFPGSYREICIDKLEFNVDGSIKKVIPTLDGIQPLVKHSKTYKN